MREIKFNINLNKKDIVLLEEKGYKIKELNNVAKALFTQFLHTLDNVKKLENINKILNGR